MTTGIILGLIITGLLLYRHFSNKSNDRKSTENLVVRLSTEEFVEIYNTKQGQVKGGSLCFYGYWFGKPYDNYHQLDFVTFDSSTNTLILNFKEKETLSITNPQEICEFENRLTIGSADKISWKWFYYGKPQTENNLYFIEINRTDNLLKGETNVDSHKSNFKDLNVMNPAVSWI